MTMNAATPLDPTNLIHKTSAETITGQHNHTKPLATPGGHNFARNGTFARWTNGPTNRAPNEWTYSGVGGGPGREASPYVGQYAATVLRSGADCFLFQRVDVAANDFPTPSLFGSTQVVLGAWVYATVASRVRLAINDGVGTTTSAYHTGSSAWEWLQVTRVIDAAATKVEIRLQVDTGNTTGKFAGIVLALGSGIAPWMPAPATALLEGAVQFNYIYNGGMETWGAGSAVAPTGWTLNGAGSSVARSATMKMGAYSASVVRAGTDCFLLQDISDIPDYGPIERWQNTTVTFGAFVKANASGAACVRISDGVTVAQSSFHSGNTDWEWLTATIAVAATATSVTVQLAILNTNDTVLFDGATLVIGPWLPESMPSGWRGRKCVVAFGSDAVQNQSTTEFLGVGTKSATEVQVTQRAPFRCVARNLHVNLDAAPAAGQTAVVTFRTAETTDTAIAATVTDAGRTASDVADEVAMAQGTLFCLKSVLSATSGNRYPHGTIELEEVPAGI